MSPCEEYLRLLLQKRGFISVEEFMEIALYHPEFGYYMQTQPLGSEGDFITAPEVSLLFGETLCCWAMGHYHRLNQPSKIGLAELGPGRGTLMRDFLRLAQGVPAFAHALEIHLLEKSPLLEGLQRHTLKDFSIFWHKDLEQMLQALCFLPTLFIANEFFDALSIQQFQKTPQGWEERGVILGTKNELIFGFRSIEPPKLRCPQGEKEKILEVCPFGEEIMEKVVSYLRRASGAALVIDYGYCEGQGETLQAVSRHQSVDILSHLGTIDLTAHVNFKVLQNIAGAAAQIKTQGEFLRHHGILGLAQAHAQKASPLQKEHLSRQLYKLTSSQEMGTLFKVLEVTA